MHGWISKAEENKWKMLHTHYIKYVSSSENERYNVSGSTSLDTTEPGLHSTSHGTIIVLPEGL